MSFDPFRRLLERVTVSELDECWPFNGPRLGGRGGETYGVASQGGGKTNYAHRLAFCYFNGISPSELSREIVVRHTCDNPICCNPLHLLCGSQWQNAQDMVARGRSLRGEVGTNVILTEEQVHEIRNRLKRGEMHKDIASDYGVSRTAISVIKSGKNWGWLPKKDAA